MSRADGSFTCTSSVGTTHYVATMLLYYGCLFLYFDWTKAQPYKIGRADGSFTSTSSIGTIHFVATDFNPLAMVQLKQLITTLAKEQTQDNSKYSNLANYQLGKCQTFRNFTPLKIQ